MKIEEFGPFELWQHKRGDPFPGRWAIAYDGRMLPLLLADRDACLLIVGIVLAGQSEQVLAELARKYSLAEPITPITHHHIIHHMSNGT